MTKKILQLVHWKSLYPLRVTQQSWLRRLCLALVGPALIQQFKGGGEPISGREVTAEEQPLTPTGTQYQAHQSWAHMSITTASLSLSLSHTSLSPWHCRGEYWIQQALCSRHSVFTELCTMLRWERERQCVRERGQVKESQIESERASALQRVIEEKKERVCEIGEFIAIATGGLDYAALILKRLFEGMSSFLYKQPVLKWPQIYIFSTWNVKKKRNCWWKASAVVVRSLFRCCFLRE